MRTQRQRGGGVLGLGAAAMIGLAAGLLAPACSSSSNNDTGGGVDAAPTDTGPTPRPDSGVVTNPDATTTPDTGPMMTPDAGPMGCTPTGTGTPMMTMAAATTATTTFTTPLNSLPSSDGTKIYFIADSPNGPGVFSVAATGGTASPLKTGSPFVTPIDLQISTDGATLYVLDIGAEDDTNVKKGRIFSMSSGGGTPTPITAADGTRPRGVDLIHAGSADVLYYTGVDTDGSPAIFKMNADGSMMMTFVKGDPFTDLGGIAVTKTGDIYVADGSGTIFKVSGGNTTVFQSGVQFGFPEGMALSADETALLVSLYDTTAKGAALGRYALTGGGKSSFNSGIAMQKESAGIHRARCADIYSWANADGCAGCANAGGVYLVKGQ